MPPDAPQAYRPNQLFPGQAEDEDILIFIRRHWMPFVVWLVLIGIFLLVAAALGVLSMVLFGMPAGRTLIYAALGASSYLLLLNAIFFTIWIEQYLDVAIITTDRLVHIRQIGLFNRRVSELSLARIQDVSAHMGGYLQSIFQYGTVVVETAGGAPDFVIRNVAKPHVVANTILLIHDRLRLKEAGAVQGGRSEAPVVEQSLPSSSTIQAAIEQAMPSIAPPPGYSHAHLQSDLVSAAMEAQEELAEEERSAVEPAPEPPAASPNRLRPPRTERTAQRQEGELVEGEHVSIEGQP